MKTKIKYTILLAFASVFFGVACKKDKTTPVAKIKTITYAPGGFVETYQYDAQGRISRLTNSSVTGYSSFEYKGSDSIIKWSFNGSDSIRNFVYKLNGIGLAVVYQAVGIFGSTSTYKYDGNNFPQSTAYSGFMTNSADTFVIAASNITQHTSAGSFLATSSYTKQAYTYLTDKTNTVTNEAKGMSFSGRSSANLVNTESYNSHTSTPTTTIHSYNYTYEFGTNNWVTKMTKTDETSAISTETYTYY